MGLLNQRLRSLRESAQPPISASEMAERLGFDSRQAYHFYESEGARGFKKPHLPIDLAGRIAKVLLPRGVDPADVMELAGVGDAGERSPLSAAEEQLLDKWRRLSPTQRKLVAGLIDELLGDLVEGEAVPPGAPPPPGRPGTLHSPALGFRAEKHA